MTLLNENDSYNYVPKIRTTVENIKKELLEEVKLKIGVFVEGISFDPKDIKKFPIGTEYQEQIHILFDMDKAHHSGFLLPSNFYLPHGVFAAFRWDPDSRYKLVEEDGKAVLYRDKSRLTEIDFYKRPKLLSYNTKNGEAFGHIANFNPEGSVNVCYSNECALKDTGDDCLFCNINSTAGAYKSENIFIKTPEQVGEVVSAAYKEGVGNHVNVTGGFIPERREIDYYADVAVEIREQTGLDDFNGTAVIGAPLDFGVIEKYKEAGYRTIAMNLEIWDKNYYKTICPGKEKTCGGRDHWIEALEYAAQVFGRGNVRSNLVAGIEPKQSILEGVEYLAEKGVLCYANAWCPNPGSALEGHRTPETEWHFDLQRKVADIFIKNGYKVDQLYDGAGNSSSIHDIFRIETENFKEAYLPQYKFKQL